MVKSKKKVSKKIKSDKKKELKNTILQKKEKKKKHHVKHIKKNSHKTSHHKSLRHRVKHHQKKEIKIIYKKERDIRIKTGIKYFDDLIEGGLKKDSTNMIVGGSGSGKSIFATQFLIEGMKRGENCLYVTFEENKKQFFSNMLKFGWNLAEYEKKGLFSFLEYTPIKVKNMLEEGGGAIENLVISKKVSRIVIDSISSFALLFEDELERREAALSLFNMIRRWNCTSILTLEEEPGNDDETESPKSLEFESDSIILLYFIKEKNKRQRYLEILKMRGTKHSKQTYKFNIEKSGIMIEKGSS
ncbi:MAG: ATPase domain-containing protein [Nanoarchaeota archaeon]